MRTRPHLWGLAAARAYGTIYTYTVHIYDTLLEFTSTTRAASKIQRLSRLTIIYYIAGVG
jgi:hypothetical protein